ncbi:MAG: hypothetical protein QXX84_07195 [Sulfolobales archaeon]
MKILSVKEIPLPIVKKMLLEAEARGSKLQDLQRRVLEHASIFSKCDDEAASELFDKLGEIGLREITRVQIINICPKRKDELLTLMNFESKGYGEEELETVLRLLREYCKC